MVLKSKDSVLHPQPSAEAARLYDDGGTGNAPIAIIGIGCRFPGGAHDPLQFWKLLCDGVDAITEVPADRWSIERFYDPNQARPGTAVTKWGGFVQQRIELFDALFFGMSPREAAHLDPMQRWLLEVVWEALDDSGHAPEQIAGTDTGVFIGGFTEDAKLFQLGEHARDQIGPHTATSHAMTMLANRISYLLDVHGPSLALDTACSSSLVAVHLACQSLWQGECTLALAGGANAMFKPEHTIAESKAGMLSPDGRSKSFDSRANGYVRGEGAGVVVLKTLAQAQADGDPIYAVIRSSAVNQDGRTNGITVPNGSAQEALVRAAYARAGIAPRQVQYVEAHGTGTPVGDPIEARALGAVLGHDRPADQPCVIGSVKTNIGHLEAAAGIAGLIKTALCLKHQQIPPHLHLQTLNPTIPLAELGLRIPQTLEPWPAHEGPALASVNSFGFGGTNAHLVLEQAPTRPAATTPPAERAVLLPLSARSSESLQLLAQRYRDLLHTTPDQTLGDLVYSASVRRSHYEHRLALVAHSRDELVSQLEAYLRDLPYDSTSAGRKQPHPPRIAFVFGGMGPQWWAMGRTLINAEPVFRAVIERCDALLAPYASWSLLAELLADEASSRMGETQIAQPANFAIQVALVELWRSWGIEPAAIVGHSAGEVAAVYMAGGLSLEDAIRVIYHRSRLQHQTTGQGKLVAVGLPLVEAQRALEGYEERISIAAVNSPSAVTLVGDPDALAAVVAPLQEQEIFCRYLNVDVPYHSHYMEPLRAELLDVLGDLQLNAATLPLFSTVTGQRVDGRELDAEYWWRNVREPVFFARAIDALYTAGYDLFLEIGPHPVLSSSIKECLALRGAQGTVLTSLRRKADERATLLEALGALYARGAAVQFAALHEADAQFVRVPTYPWHREHLWAESDESAADRLGHADHTLLGYRVRGADPTWQTTLDLRRLPYLDDHRLQGAIVYPGAAYVESCLAAASVLTGARVERIALEQIEFRKALFLSIETYPVLQLIANQQHGTVGVYSRPEAASGAWTLHMSAQLRPQLGGAAAPRLALDQLRDACSRMLSSQECYAHFRQLGLEYGPTFQGIQQLWRGGNTAIAQFQLHPAVEAERSEYAIHPVILDLCFQALLATMIPEQADAPEQAAQVYMPVTVERVRLLGPLPAQLWVATQLVARDGRSITGDVQLCDETGLVVAEALGVRAQAVDDGAAEHVGGVADMLYRLQWLSLNPPPQPVERPEPPATWIIFADGHGLGRALAAQLEQRGEICVLVTPGDDYRAADDRRQYWLNPARPEEFDELFRAALDDGRAPCRGVVQLWGLEPLAADALSVAALERAQTYGSIATMQIVQALDRIEWRESPRLWIVTRGAQAVVEGADVAVAHAPLWGLARVIAAEHRSLWGGIIDLDSLPDTDEPALLLSDLWHTQAGDQVAWRAGQRFVPQLVRAAVDTSAVLPPGLRVDGTYLITGGLGGLGLAVARWMAQHGARRLILMGRTQLPPRTTWREIQDDSPLCQQITAIRELEALGVTVHLAAVDVADAAQLAAFLDTFEQEGWPPIRGVIHAAGLLRDRTILQLDAATFNAVFQPKVAGAWLLHTLLRDAPLDFFVLFSSVAAVLGSVTQANYAAANAFLDALAHHRRAQGLPALSINWGPWAEVGMAARLGEQGGRLGVQAVKAIPVRAGLDALEHLLRQRGGQVGVFPIDWPEWFETYPQAEDAAFFAQLLAAQRSDTGEQQSSTARFSRAQLLALDVPARPAALSAYLCEQVIRVLRLPQPTLDSDLPLNTLGLDSMIAVELKNRIDSDLQTTLSIVTFLQGASVDDLTALLLERVVEEPAPALVPIAVVAPVDQSVPVADDDMAALLSKLDDLSDSDIDLLLDKML